MSDVPMDLPQVARLPELARAVLHHGPRIRGCLADLGVQPEIRRSFSRRTGVVTLRLSLAPGRGWGVRAVEDLYAMMMHLGFIVRRDARDVIRVMGYYGRPFGLEVHMAKLAKGRPAAPASADARCA